eukprot:XP_021134489.2 coiled-coil domain-containing protein 81 [Anas platyrhynchos]
MAAMASFSWSWKGEKKASDWKASERALFPTLSYLTTKEIVQIWDQASLDVQRQLAAGKHVRIVGLGTFAVLMQELCVGRNDCLLIRRPVFQLSNTARKILNLTYAKRIIPDSAPVVPLDYTMIALETSKPPDAVRNCLNETVMYLSRCIASELNIDFVFRDMGILSFKHMEVQMRFYEKFLLSLDTTGNIKEVLGNRKKGIMSWVISQEEPGVPDILTKPDILFPSLQGKTEYGEFFLKSLCERPTKPLQEKKMKDFFKKKPNRKGVLSALPHNCPVKVKAVSLEEGPGEKVKRRESSVRRLSGVWRSSQEEAGSKEMLEAKAQTARPVPDRYIEALEEMEKLAVVWHSQRVLTASAPGKEKKAEAENNTRRTQLKTQPETHKKGHELNLGATRGRQKTDKSQEGSGRAAFEK